MMSDVLQPQEPARGLTFENVWAMFQETSRETDRRMKETERQMKEMSARTDRQIGKLGNRFGELVEHLIAPNLVEKFRTLSYAFTRAGLDQVFFDANGQGIAEVDVWLENGEFVMAVEIKSHLLEQNVDRHMERMEILRAYLNQREDKRKLLGAVAAAIVNTPVKNYALKKGFYVIEQSGDTLKIDVPENFKPRTW
jgi:hypothetical protein